MKSWAKLLIGAAAITSGGVGSGWYVMSGNLVTTIKQSIDQANEAGGAGKAKVTISYNAIERSAFPTIGARITDIGAQVELPAHDAVEGISVQWKTNGAVEIISDPLHNQYRMKGNTATETHLAQGEKSFSLHADSTPVEMTVRAINHKAFRALSFANLKDEASNRAMLESIAQMNLQIGAMRVTDGAGEMLYSQEAFGLTIAHNPDAQFNDIDLALQLKDSLTTPAYQTLVSSFTHGMDGKTEPFNAGNLPFAGSRAGKQNFDIAAHVKLPKAGLEDDAATVDVVFSKFEISNDFYRLKLPLSLQRQKVGSSRIIKAKLDGEYTLSEAGGTEVRTYLVPFAAQLAGLLHNKPEDAERDASMVEKLVAALPTVTTVGPVTVALDLEADLGQGSSQHTAATKPNEGKDAPGAANLKDQYTLNRFALNHSHWGIDAKGMFINPNDGQSGIVSDITIHCLKCSALIADAYSQARSVQEAMNLVTPDRPQWRIDETVEKQVGALIDEIGKKDPATGDITLAITTPTPGNVQINDKSIAEVMPKLMAIIAPEMAAQMPAAGAPAGTLAPQK